MYDCAFQAMFQFQPEGFRNVGINYGVGWEALKRNE